MPSFAGQPFFFGRSVTMITADNPRADQRNAFFGLNNQEILDGGLRGRFTQARGLIWGVDWPSFQFNRENFRSYNNGFFYTLVDTAGVVWLLVKLEAFELTDKIKRDAVTGGFFQQYAARFHHAV